MVTITGGALHQKGLGVSTWAPQARRLLLRSSYIPVISLVKAGGPPKISIAKGFERYVFRVWPRSLGCTGPTGSRA